MNQTNEPTRQELLAENAALREQVAVLQQLLIRARSQAALARTPTKRGAA